MQQRWPIVVLFSLLVAILPVAGQDSAPYVSRLKAENEGKRILVTWKDAESSQGAVYQVYRSNAEITKDNFTSARMMGSVASGIQQFADKSPEGRVFYLVLLVDKSGKLMEYFLPYRNKTVTPISLSDESYSDTVRIAGLSASPLGKQILVSFNSEPGDKKMAVFRSTKKISTLTDLKDAAMVGQVTGFQAPFRDTPPPGVDYFYTVLDAQAFAEGATDVFTPLNTLGSPVSLPLLTLPEQKQKDQLEKNLRPTLDPGLRPLPLPKLVVEKDPVTGSNLPPTALVPQSPRPLGEQTRKILTQISKGSEYGPKPLPELRILPEEKSPDPQGLQKDLSRIVLSYFAGKEWESSKQQLGVIQTQIANEKMAARIHFYQGQCLAYTQDFKRAVLEFLLAQKEYNQECTPFLDSLLTQLRATGENYKN